MCLYKCRNTNTAPEQNRTEPNRTEPNRKGRKEGDQPGRTETANTTIFYCSSDMGTTAGPRKTTTGQKVSRHRQQAWPGGSWQSFAPEYRKHPRRLMRVDIKIHGSTYTTLTQLQIQKYRCKYRYR